MITLQDIVREHMDDTSPYTQHQKNALRQIARCGTPENGEIVMACGSCNQTKRFSASCGNRYCNRCGSHRNAEWLDKRMQDMLPIPHFMVTFTIPEHLRDLFYANQELCYGLLFAKSVETLRAALAVEWGQHVKTGFASFLHTWTQDLRYHPHVHVLVPAGGLSEDEVEWIRPRKKDWLCSYQILSSLFKAKLCDALLSHFKRGMLKWPKTRPLPETSAACKSFLLGKKEIHWRTHTSIPKGGVTGAFDYMARYVFRSAIGNNRLLANKDGQISIAVKNRETGESQKVTLKATEFMHRLAMHILPKGFTRIRWYGILSCARRKIDTAIVRGILNNHQLAISQNGFLEVREKIRQRLASQACPGCGAARMFLRSFRTAWDILKGGGAPSETVAACLGQRWHGKMMMGCSPG
jgi:hypothetical protein